MYSKRPMTPGSSVCCESQARSGRSSHSSKASQGVATIALMTFLSSWRLAA